MPKVLAEDTTEIDALRTHVELLSAQLSDAVERRDDLNRQVIRLSSNAPTSVKLTPQEAEGYRMANRHLDQLRIMTSCPKQSTDLTAFIAKLKSLLGDPATA